MAKLHDYYKNTVQKDLQKKFKLASIMQVPKVEKITLNMGIGEAVSDKKILQNAKKDLTAIAGQAPLITYAKKSVAGFKVREGFPIGLKVTLRRKNMWHFLERLISVALPRVRDFRGLNKNSFDGRGNYSLGIKEQIIFPEINYDTIDKIRGLDITITTSGNNDTHSKALLEAFKFPFRA